MAIPEADKKIEMEKQFYQRQKMETIGSLACRVAHDLNNYLTAIMGFTELAMQDLGMEHPVYKTLDKVLATSYRASNIVKQLLVFSRNQQTEPKIISLNHIITGMEPMLKEIIGKDIELTMKLENGLKNIKANICLIEQVIINMVVNAREAMPKGGALIIETSTYTEGLPQHYARLSCRDTGIGISEDVKTHIFEPFFTTKENGTGLGLLTVHEIVRQCGGYIKVKSSPGAGTTFDIYLPIASEETEDRGGRQTT